MDSDKKKKINRRTFLKGAASSAITGGAAVTVSCKGKGLLGSTEAFALEFQEYFKKYDRLMSQDEREQTVARLERLARLKQDIAVNIDTTEPAPNVLYGYAFNVTRCEGFMECIQTCVKENNLDRKSKTQYIQIFEMAHGQMTPDQGESKYFHMVPKEGHFYMGVQCYHCDNPPCVKACPTGARVFGNLLDPDSEIRFVLENKKVYRLKEDLGTEPKFWYFID